MPKKQHILNYCRIKDNKISLNGKTVFQDHSSDLKSFFKNIYKELELSYPKFFKMDNLSKLGFLASEILFKDANLNQATKEHIGIVLSNKSASLDTDRKYQDTISDKDNYFPSPAVFVYTLANIMIGEISIRHQIKGENVFFVSETFNETLLEQYASSLIQNEKSSHILCGWVDVDNDQYDAFMYLVTEEESQNYSKEIIKKIYTEN